MTRRATAHVAAGLRRPRIAVAAGVSAELHPEGSPR